MLSHILLSKSNGINDWQSIISQLILNFSNSVTAFSIIFNVDPYETTVISLPDCIFSTLPIWTVNSPILFGIFSFDL